MAWVTAIPLALVVAVIADATRVCIRTLRQPETVTTTETPYVESTLVAPSGMLATREERHAMAAAGGGYVREVTGESAYERYVERERHQHPSAAVLDRRAFERRRQDLVGSQPQQRCC